jgi:hypothetical protein
MYDAAEVSAHRSTARRDSETCEKHTGLVLNSTKLIELVSAVKEIAAAAITSIYTGSLLHCFFPIVQISMHLFLSLGPCLKKA